MAHAHNTTPQGRGQPPMLDRGETLPPVREQGSVLVVDPPTAYVPN